MAYPSKIRRLTAYFTTEQFHIALIIVGILLRLKLYLENHSFWVDEAWVAINIASRSISEIFQHIPSLHDWPNRPIGFSFIEKIFILLLGNNEYAFRLYPLLSGIFSIILFYFLLKRFVHSKIVTVALALFVFCGQLIHFSAELKQFSSDVLIILVLFWAFDWVRGKNYNRRSILVLGLIGGLAIWFSHTSLFVLCAIGFILAKECLFKEKRINIVVLLSVYLFWVTNFILLYTICLRHTMSNPALLNYWDGTMLAVPLFTGESFIWLKESFLNMFVSPIGVGFPLLSSILFIFGCFSVYKENKENFYLLLVPIATALFVSALNKYLFYGRFLLFSIPSVVIFVSSGIMFLTRQKHKFVMVIRTMLIALILFNPLKQSFYSFTHSLPREENREVLQYLKNNFARGDFLFCNGSATFAYFYYATPLEMVRGIPKFVINNGDGSVSEYRVTGKFNNKLMVSSRGKFIGHELLYNVFNNDGYYRDTLVMKKNGMYNIYHDTKIKEFDGKRVWIFLSHVQPRYKEFLLDVFDSQGKRLKLLEGRGASIYLYELEKSL